MGLIHLGNAQFVDEKPIEWGMAFGDQPKRKGIRAWTPKTPGKLSRAGSLWTLYHIILPAKELAIYPYVEFPSLERSRFGLAVIEGGPKGKWIEFQNLGTDTYSPDAIAPLSELSYVIEDLLEGRTHAVEDQPFSEIRREYGYNDALIASMLREAFDPDSAAHAQLIKDESEWQGPGVYDMRDEPPSYHSSLENYELSSMEYWADESLEMMFQGDEWKKVFENLLIGQAA